MSITTAADMIRTAMKLNRIIGQGETPSNEEMVDGLDILNMMLESWSVDRLYVFAEYLESITLQAAKNAYTWGTGGDITSTRPVRLTSAFTVDTGGASHPAHILQTAAEYDQIQIKGAPGPWPTHVFLDPSYPLATLRMWPTPSTSYTLYLRSYQQLQSFANATDTISLPPGYKQAIIYNLAVAIAGAFGIEPVASVVRIATTAAGRIRRLNVPVGKSNIEAVMMNGSRVSFNILTGE